MSNGVPLNPLDAFQTYSVQYILLACRSTTAARSFAQDDQLTASLAAVNATKNLGDAVKFGTSIDDVYLILDTRRFSQFTVENLKYDVWVNGLHKGAAPPNLATDLSMTILDSTGVSFANFLQWIMDEKMQTNYDGMLFMLRTIFVGHHENGRSEVVQSETIPMHLMRMDVDLDYAKGTYLLEFMPNMNFDVSKNFRFLRVPTGAASQTGPGNQLGSLITNFQKNLNDLSAKYYDDVAKVSGPLGRKVLYQITLPKSWGSRVLGSSTVGNTTEVKHSSESAEANRARTQTINGDPVIQDSFVDAHPGMLITRYLDEVFRRVPEIAEYGNFKQKQQSDTGVVTFYKHIVGLTSDNDTVTVHVDVVEFVVPHLFVQKNQSTVQVDALENSYYTTLPDGPGRTKRVPRDFLEWDYIFSGRNDSILNFDLKIQEFQMLLAQNLQLGTGAMHSVSDGERSKETAEQRANDDSLLYLRKYDPLLLPLDSESALANYQQYYRKATETTSKLIETEQRYLKNISMFYAGSPITAMMTIKGNPLIMHKFNIGKLLPHVTDVPRSQTPGKDSSSTSSSGAIGVDKYREELENDILRLNPDLQKSADRFALVPSPLSVKSYAVSPVFARVNVYGPNVDFRTNEQKSGKFTSSVLSENYYVIFKVSNVFAGSVFTQELELYSHNLFGSQKVRGDK